MKTLKWIDWCPIVDLQPTALMVTTHFICTLGLRVNSIQVYALTAKCMTFVNHQFELKLITFFLRIMGLGVNNCGRGINVIIIDRLTKSIVKAVNFDTFAEGIYTHICCTLLCHSYIILLYFIIYF